MPNINRIRVNNVKYNFGTQGYDDFSMRMYGKNTLYDLANGGGKSVLMLLLLQNLIPNCTLDEKQPIEKLFRTGSGNTTIHSLVEWKLDDKDIKDGFRYMTTGFCARKAKDVEDKSAAEGETETTAVRDKSESASVEYFNYCIFYRDYNDNDIVNLPLQDKKERITYSGLKRYLKELATRTPALKVFVFERKGEYQRFISTYGLFESQWEIIRGINKTEGHVRTYFETHYKTTRKVVEDLLIEEIIEKAFNNKTQSQDDGEDMAKTLLEIKDKLVELSKKKHDIESFDREAELMGILENRVSSFLKLYEERDEINKALADIYVTGEDLNNKSIQKTESLEEKKRELNQKLLEQKKRIEELKVLRDSYILEEAKAHEETSFAELSKTKEELQSVEDELSLKESINDYIKYLSDKQALFEHQAVIDAADADNVDWLTKLHILSGAKKKMDDDKLIGLRAELDKCINDGKTAREDEERLSHILEEGKIALAVAKSHRDELSEEYRLQMEEIAKVRKEISILVLADIKGLSKELADEEERLSAELESCETILTKLDAEIADKEKEVREFESLIEKAKEELQKAIQNNLEYEENKERLEKMDEIYKESGDATLYEIIKDRAFRQQVVIANLEERMKKIESHILALEEGRIIEESEAVLKVIDYLKAVHGDFAMSGIAFISALPVANRQELIARYPMLPYGVVTENFSVLEEDERLGSLDLGSFAVPIYDKSVIMEMGEAYKEDGVILVAKKEESFTAENAIELEKERIFKMKEELQEELYKSRELFATYSEDLDYVTRLKDESFVNAAKQVAQGKEKIIDLEKQLKAAKVSLELFTEQRNAKKEELAKARSDFKDNQSEQIKLAGIMGKSEVSDETEEKLAHYKSEVLRLEADVEKASAEYESSKKISEELSQKESYISETIEKTSKEFNEVYVQYYDESVEKDSAKAAEIAKIAAGGMNEDELRAEFLAAKTYYESATVALEDKKQLVATLSESMYRSLRLIGKRGVSVDSLEELEKSGGLVPVDEDKLNDMSKYVGELSSRVSTLSDEHKRKVRESDRLEGKIEQESIAIGESFGDAALQELKELLEERVYTKEEAKQAIGESDRVLENVKKEIKDFDAEYESYLKNSSAIKDLFKDVKRIIDSEEIDVSVGEVLVSRTGDEESVREAFESSLLSHDKSKKSIEKAGADLATYRMQTADTFYRMGAFELAASVRDDIEIPKTYGEAKELLASIREMIAYIHLEKERVNQGIADMETIKVNFENQCIERCRDVKTELSKLPKLSHIVLDGESIQMVDLTIPYVKDEFVSQRMSDYIDEVVSGADKYENDNDRIKFIQSKLMLKKMFSVLVTDMNAIRLKLYKRERIKEQSRYLRYEEAVGSTGQSQGIYIQFLISIINYISGMYAPEAESADLKKTIFIDNPFGAAKDIYIWEPIFALLQANNVQLIVPARGATPAITCRFDVNYVLGQQLVDGRQQTVVVDYRSQVDAKEVEYSDLEYSQVTFDFI